MIDVDYDCRIECPNRDPDSHSPTLRRFHKLLWSKELPCGKIFELDDSGPKPWLVHKSELGEFHLTSDAIVHLLGARLLLDQLPRQQRDFVEGIAWPVSECIVFPGKRVNRLNTINGARGMNPRIADRFDLTLECIRRHYLGSCSPLSEVLRRYASFFTLFESFEGYTHFFHLGGLVDPKSGGVRFYLPLEDFNRSGKPQSLDEYVLYLENVEAFTIDRAAKMTQWCKQFLSINRLLE